MLQELYIYNIALIKSLRIEFERGLNVLTGETGAGKSIVVDCVNMALGHRADRELVQTGAQKGGVKALFDISGSPAAQQFLNEMQIDFDDNMVEVERELALSGRNITRINGTMVPLTTLKAFTSNLVDLHGQQEHQKLMDPAQHVMYLDSYGGEEISKLKLEVRGAYEKYTEARRKLNKLDMDEATRAQRIDILRMQVNEITSAKLKKGEEEELEKRSKVFENSEKLASCTRIAYERMYQGGKSLSAQESIKRALDSFRQIANLDTAYEEICARLESLYAEAQDLGYELQAIYEDLSFDPGEAERVQDRLDLIKRLSRKYGAGTAEIIEYGKKAQAELNALESIDSEREEAKENCEKLKKVLAEKAEALSEARRRTAKVMEQAILEQLKALGMAKTRLETGFTKRDSVREDGAEDVEFLISPNPGEPLRPLAAIASGGEISRFMLALKVILAQNDGIETLIFDEIDTGISGRMAQVVGEKMSLLGKDHQVICVTHLAQIAALGDTQFLVEKTVNDDRTDSRVSKLTPEGRVNELTRLVGGAETDESGREHARSMLDAAWKLKAEIRK